MSSLQDAIAFTSSLDLSQLLFFQACLSTLAAVSASPAYNLPLALYGLYVVEKGSGETLRRFAVLYGFTILLDLWWLTGSHDASTLGYLIVLINFFAKPVTLLATVSNLRTQGLPTMGNISIGGNDQASAQRRGTTVWSADDSGPYQAVDELDEEADIPQRPAPTSYQQQSLPPQRHQPLMQNTQPISTQPPPRPSNHTREGSGGYHTLG